MTWIDYVTTDKIASIDHRIDLSDQKMTALVYVLT